MAAPVPKKRIGEMLLEAGIIDETQLKAALGHQRQWGVRLGQALVDLKLATEADIVRALSLKFGFEVAKLDALEPYGHEQALKLLPREFAIRNNVFPMWADTANLTVAMSDPTNLAVVDEIRFRTGRRVKVNIGGDHEIAEAVRRHFHVEGAVEAIALDLDGDPGVAGEAVFDPFGGGSKDALEAFFGGGADAGAAEAPAAEAPPAPPQAAVAAAPRPAAGPAPARPAAPAAPRPAAPAPGAPQRPAAAAPRPAPAPPAGRAIPVQSTAARPALPATPAGELELEELTGEHDAVEAEELTPLEEAASEAALAAAEPEPQARRELTEREAAILDSLDRLASGAPAQPDVVKPTQAIAALIRLMIRKRVITELEFLDELAKR